MRSMAPGAKFSTITSHISISFVRIRLPSGVLGFRVILRLFEFSMVK